MRIALVHQYYAPDVSAVAHLAASFAEHRAAMGDEVTVVASQGGYVPESAVVAQSTTENPRVHRLWTPRFGKRTVLQRLLDYLAFYTLAAWRLLTLPRQDVIVLLTTPPFIGWTGVLHQILHPRTKLLLWNMDCYPEVAVQSGLLRPGGWPDRLMRGMNRLLFRRLSHVICLDSAMVELLETNYDIDPKQLPLSIIPNWEPLELFPAVTSSRRWEKHDELDLADRFVVLYLGNAGFGHQFDSVLAAARELRNDPITFLFVGGGQRWSRLAEAKQEHKLDNVILHGYVPKEQTPSLMASADCALITLRDNMLGVMSPSKMHSNLAAGLPVLYVGPRKSNVDDAIGQFGCGVSVREGDVAGIVSFLRQSMDRSESFRAMRRRARQAFEQAYCDRVTLQQFDQVIASLADESALAYPASTVPVWARRQAA
jgi:colanic acid biosynthesis glycosyl transferase WcaI